MQQNFKHPEFGWRFGNDGHSADVEVFELTLGRVLCRIPAYYGMLPEHQASVALVFIEAMDAENWRRAEAGMPQLPNW